MATDETAGNGHRNGNGNGNGDGNGRALERRVEAQREVVRRTASELEDRLRDKTHEVREKIENAREKVQEVREKMHVVGDRMHDVTEFVQRHRYAVLGGALVAGAVLGLRSGGKRKRRTRASEENIRYVMAEQPKKASLIGSLIGAGAAFAAKQGVSYLTERLQGGGEAADDHPERYQLPPARRRPFVE
ncbi:MAG TPA: hypothetical protein VMZ28_09860 [Kofleriaceae bacterium]|nr:hypothetical protein [Kofleriaceae bacterium]